MRIKTTKTLLVSIISLILWISVYYMAVKILDNYELGFRNWVNNIFWIVTILLFFISIITGIIILGKCGFNTTKPGLKIASWIGVLTLAAGLIIGGYICILATPFMRPEHVVDKEGKKMVASVRMSFNVYVDYYDYVNGFVRGKHRLCEDYGNGSFDPFERETIPIPSKTYYLNE
jgi:hypothetical protein